jgi:hypothetical protein
MLRSYLACAQRGSIRNSCEKILLLPGYTLGVRQYCRRLVVCLSNWTFKLLPQLQNCQKRHLASTHVVVAAEATSFIDMAGGLESEQALVFTRARPNSWPMGWPRWCAVREASVCYVATAVRLTRVDISCLSWALVHGKRAVVANRVSAAWTGEFEGTNKGC